MLSTWLRTALAVVVFAALCSALGANDAIGRENVESPEPFAVILRNPGKFEPGMRATVNFEKPLQSYQSWRVEVAVYDNAQLVFNVIEQPM